MGPSLVLSEANQYIENLNFDITRRYLVNKDIIEGREHDPIILTASLANPSHGAWSHRPDDKYLHDGNTVLTVNRSLVTLYLNCCSYTVECRVVCGYLISQCFLNSNNQCVLCGHQSLTPEHILCGWSIKLVRYSNNPSSWQQVLTQRGRQAKPC